MEALARDFQELLRILAEHDVRFLVVGGYAVAAFGFASLGLTAADFEELGVVVQLGREPGRVDLLTSVTGLTFVDAYPARITAAFGGTSVPILDRASLIANKRAAGRPQDLADVAKLERGPR